MNKQKKKVLAFLLTVIMIWPILPTGVIYANYQNPVSDLVLTDYSSITLDKTGEYKLNFKFTRPAVSDKIDTAAIVQSMSERAQKFDLYWRNVTSRTNFDYNETNKVIFENTTPEDTIIYDFSPNLDFGSIYMYKVIPWHTHEYINPIPMAPNITSRAPMDMPEMTKEVLYLSDIRVQATGTDKDITVVWDNPAFLGNDLFTSYKIYYQQGGAAANLDDETASYIRVQTTDASLIRITAEGKLSYTFPNPGLDVGKLYAIKVVPEYNGKTISQGNLIVKASGKDYTIAASGREYRNNELYIKPSLTITREGKDLLKLSWESYLNSMLDIESIEIYKSESKDFSNAVNLYIISGQAAKIINYALVDRPSNTTYYKVIIKYTDRTDPLNPVVKQLETMIKEYNPAYEAFKPMKPTVLKVEDTDVKPFSMNITWEAFVRQAYTDAEKNAVINSDGDIIDKGVLYDIYITDDLTNFDENNNAFLSQKIVDEIPADSLTDVIFNFKVGNDTIKRPAYEYSVQYYITKENGAYVRKTIEDNKIYYIMIIAKRDPSGEISAKSYYSHYYEPKLEISVRPIMLAKPPLRIKKNADGVEVITKDSITIQWETNWYELYNASDGNWYSKAGVKKDGTLVFGDKITNDLIAENRVLEFNGSRYNTQQDPYAAFSIIYDNLKRLNAIDPEKSYPIRYMNLGNVQYEINVVPYDAVQSAGGYDAYKESLTEADWSEVTIIGSGIMLELEVKNINKPSQSPLLPNMAYTILLRPFIIDADGKKQAYYPNYIVATTLSDRPPLEITPTVPVIEAVYPTTDTSVTIRFEYSEGLKYELFWSDLFPDYPDKGILIPDADIRAKGTLKSENGKTYLYYTIVNLFPNTIYNVWIRSYADNQGGRLESDYSNPVSMTTQDMAAPDPPQGLGLASPDHMDIYNKENDKTLLPIDYEYMVIEWYKNINDFTTAESETPTPGGAGETAATEILSSPNIKDNYLVMFNNLIGNRDYYIRAKTRLTITKTADGIASYYQYIVQMSPDIDFTDYIEAIVPSSIPDTDPVYTMVKDSGWTNVIRLTTSPYKGEYDGDKHAEMYPLPQQDFEVIYDKNSDTLTYRYRSNEIDSKGNKDNSVDQRFISNLIKNKTYNVIADISAYNGKPVKNGVIEVPYSIVKALQDRKISLTVKSNDMTFTFMPGFIETNDIKALNNLSPASKIKIKVNVTETGLPDITAYGTYVTQPKKISVAVITPSKTINLTSLANPYKAELKLANRYTTLDKNTAAYTYTNNDTGWVRASDGVYDNETAQITFHTKRLSSYASIAKTLPKATGTGPAENSMYTVGTFMNITDMKSYNPNANVTSAQLNKLMAAIASNSKDVAINSSLTDDEQNALSKAGLMTSGAAVTREAGLNSLIKLYEIKTKSVIKDYQTAAQSQYKDITTAAPQYQPALLKAAELGFFGNEISARPTANMTIGDMLNMADIIIQDAGL